MSTSGNITTITAALQAGDFSQAVALVPTAFPSGNQPLLDAINQASTDADTAENSLEAAITAAAGN